MPESIATHRAYYHTCLSMYGHVGLMTKAKKAWFAPGTHSFFVSENLLNL